MVYAQDRIIYDADSHLMELPDFLTKDAGPEDADLPQAKLPTTGRIGAQVEEVVARGGHDAARIAELQALGDGLISGPKGYEALGAFNPAERKLALDILGFKAQLLFPTFLAPTILLKRREDDYRVSHALNRRMADFCAGDKRLLGVGLIPIDDVDAACQELEHLIGLGLKAVWIPHRPMGRSPGHPDLDPFWTRVAEAGIPFTLHVGGAEPKVPQDFMLNGIPIPDDFMGGGESIRAKDMTSLHHTAETFLSAMVLDGVLERHPTLRGLIAELGAGWVPSMLARLDWVAQIWRKSEPKLTELTRKPSQQVIDQMVFTPYVYEDVGAMIRQSDSRLYAFSSDYPHIEGGRQPLARFDESLAMADDVDRHRFFEENFRKTFAI